MKKLWLNCYSIIHHSSYFYRWQSIFTTEIVKFAWKFYKIDTEWFFLGIKTKQDHSNAIFKKFSHITAWKAAEGDGSENHKMLVTKRRFNDGWKQPSAATQRQGMNRYGRKLSLAAKIGCCLGGEWQYLDGAWLSQMDGSRLAGRKECRLTVDVLSGFEIWRHLLLFFHQWLLTMTTNEIVTISKQQKTASHSMKTSQILALRSPTKFACDNFELIWKLSSSWASLVQFHLEADRTIRRSCHIKTVWTWKPKSCELRALIIIFESVIKINHQRNEHVCFIVKSAPSPYCGEHFCVIMLI